NNSNRSTYQIKDQVRPKYKLFLRLLNSKVIAPVVFDDLFGQEIYITDYNVFNHVLDPRDYSAEQYLQLPVRRDTDVILNAGSRGKRKTYEIDLIYEYDNIFKTNN